MDSMSQHFLDGEIFPSGEIGGGSDHSLAQINDPGNTNADSLNVSLRNEALFDGLDDRQEAIQNLGLPRGCFRGLFQPGQNPPLTVHQARLDEGSPNIQPDDRACFYSSFQPKSPTKGTNTHPVISSSVN